jgi:integrase
MPRDHEHEDPLAPLAERMRERAKTTRAAMKAHRTSQADEIDQIQDRLFQTMEALLDKDITAEQAGELIEVVQKWQDHHERVLSAAAPKSAIVVTSPLVPAVIEDKTESAETSVVALLRGRELTTIQRKQLEHLVRSWDAAPVPKSQRPKLSDRLIEAALSGPLPSILKDAPAKFGGTRGLYARCHEDARSATIYLKYKSKLVRNARRVSEPEAKPMLGRSVNYKIGTWPALSVAQARQQAADLLAMIQLGQDPQAQRMAERAAARDYRKRETVTTISVKFMAERKPHVSEQHLKGEQQRLDRYILPEVGKLKAVEVTRQHAEHIKANAHQIGGPVAANRALVTLSALMTFSGREGSVTKDIKRFDEKKRDRHITDDEQAAVGGAMSLHETAGPVPLVIINMIRLAAFAGLRIGEARMLEWSEVDAAARRLRLSKGKTGSSTRPLSETALRLLAKIKRTGRYVFPKDPAGQEPFVKGDVDYAWVRIRRDAAKELPSCKSIRLHDLRHLFATVMDEHGATGSALRRALGHTTIAMSDRYVSGELKAAAKVADKAAAKIAAAMGGPTATVHRMRSRDKQ